MFGMCPRLYGKGTMACSVVDLMTRLRREEHAIAGRAEEEEMTPDIDAVLFLDRSVDLVSPMCTPLTYEALVDEILGIEHSFVTLENETKEEDEEAADAPNNGKAARKAARLRTMQENRMLQPWTCACCRDVNPPPRVSVTK